MLELGVAPKLRDAAREACSDTAFERHRRVIEAPQVSARVDLHLLAGRLGLAMEFQDLVDSKCGRYVPPAPGREIVNMRLSRADQNDTIAHEVSHHILGDEPSNRVVLTRARPSHKRQVDSLAARILLPRHRFLRAVTAGQSDRKIATEFDCSEKAAHLRRRELKRGEA